MKMRVVGLGLLLVGVLAAGCAGVPEGDTAAQDSNELAVSEQAYVGDGVVQESGGTRQFYLYGGTQFCWIYDPGQQRVLGNVSGYQYTFSYLSEYRVFQGHCHYPAGRMFQRYGDAAIYYIQGVNDYCWVSSQAQKNRLGGVVGVINVPAGRADFAETWRVGSDWMYHWNPYGTSYGRRYNGACPY